MKIQKRLKIINAGSCFLPDDRDYSCVEVETIALDRAMAAIHHWIYYCKQVELISDCEGLLGMMGKHLAVIENRKLQKLPEKAANYSWKLQYIKGKEKKIADALSLLCTKISLYSHKNKSKNPRLMSMSKRATLRLKQLETEDPLVMQLAEDSSVKRSTLRC